MMNKRVLIVAANLKIAGAQKMIEQLALYINRQKYDVRVLVLSKRMDTSIERRLDLSGIDTIYLDKASGLQISCFGKVRREINRFKPNIIHTHVNSWLYVLPSVILDGYKFIHTIHSSPERQEANAVLRKIIKRLYHSNRAFPVAISDKIRTDAVQVYDLPLSKIERVYNPVEYKTFSEISKEDHDGTVFVNVARFNAIKNQAFLIKAFARVHAINKNTSLLLAGDGELLEEAKRLVQELACSDCIAFLGNIDNVHELFSKSDVFVLPSLSEGMPISLLEAEASGMPVIASDVGGIPDVIDTNGFLIPVNNENALIKAMQSLVDNRDLRNQMGKRSQEIASQYSSEKIAKEYEALYDKYARENN